MHTQKIHDFRLVFYITDYFSLNATSEQPRDVCAEASKVFQKGRKGKFFGEKKASGNSEFAFFMRVRRN